MLRDVVAWALLFLVVTAMLWGFHAAVSGMLADLNTPTDRLAGTVQMWLDDERPAWETITAFERDVERVMRGEQTEDYVERMPLKTRKIKAADGHTVKVKEPKPLHQRKAHFSSGIPRLGEPGYTGPVLKPKRCRHVWTKIPPSTVDAFSKINGGRVRLPDMYAGRVTDPWCVKCRTHKDGRAVIDLESFVRKVKADDLSV